MSEYQFVSFRAIDRPLTDLQLKFMNRQSSRAEFTRWEYKVEYHYSSFRGDVEGMLGNGYDIFLNYTNYGDREIRIRLPRGLPFSPDLWPSYFDGDGLEWTADKRGPGGVLRIAPPFEEASEATGEFDDYLDASAKLRELLIVGDLRALFVAWLCNATAFGEGDATLLEPPVPHGLGTFPKGVTALLEFFDVDPLLIEAAATGVPAFDPRSSRREALGSWLNSITESRRREIIQRLVLEEPVALKAELLAEIRDSERVAAWPVTAPARTVAQLLELGDQLRRKQEERQKQLSAAKQRRQATKAEQERQTRMAAMKADPDHWLQRSIQLIDERGTVNYREAAQLIADLREALGGKKGERIARKHAAHLVVKYPTLHVLKSALRKHGLLS